MTTVAVVGAGTVGLSVAWVLAQSGCDVTVRDPAPGSGASWVAGGMIAPYSEAWPGEDELVHLGVRSLRLWEGFADALAPYADGAIVTARGTVWLAMDDGDAQDLSTMIACAVGVGESGGLVAAPPSVALRDVPGAARRVRAAARAPQEIAVDNRIVHRALVAACAAAGVTTVAQRVGALDDLTADRVVLCAGAASDELWPGLGVRPVKGEAVRLTARRMCLPPPPVTVRAKVNGRAVYVVPRADGVVVGATQYESDDDTTPLAGPVVDLLADAFAVLPYLREYDLAEVRAGLRPATASNLPVIRELDERVIAATGHGRNGILLSPVTAQIVRDLIVGERDTAGVEPIGEGVTAWS
ncbi:glycine oxidase ThiO [Tsukamurella soli]|uniref:glycine oxidase n=1 Tax=Tsukamurella soli TaxID=644556 RepID=A0ABP8JCC8_9ACTN